MVEEDKVERVKKVLGVVWTSCLKYIRAVVVT
jgi:hypothetical protein